MKMPSINIEHFYVLDRNAENKINKNRELCLQKHKNMIKL